MATWWVTVDGRVLPKPIGGHPALELCNTRSGWGEPFDDRQEYLRDYAYLATLGHSTEVISRERAERLIRKAARDRDAAAEVLDRTRTLRADLYAVLTGRAGRAPFERVAAAAATARGRQRLDRDGDRIAWSLPAQADLRDPLEALLITASDLLTSPQRDEVRTCPGVGCGWLFLSTGKRRWCQMAVCGNRAKQASYASRHRD
ncbi:CGNR zinc finger domain-containing protein [Luteipulveratus sp. YIM 133132]|uniref:CGNR zinc finger domain-containing protein n=1 Tax=Luteipulveratus flavus TaxID=3031728 RepID=UPI0023AF1BF1|nr:CGNR zinc finger domain-containing protein [Luteipulveratus sp. YIM 133132]MDE9364666.1 CGNR zinc finger domain-containing protein [Luteipulveratus sp. YIM 133132]